MPLHHSLDFGAQLPPANGNNPKFVALRTVFIQEVTLFMLSLWFGSLAVFEEADDSRSRFGCGCSN